MSWGTELWDQYDNVSQHTQKGLDFLERYGHFLRDRANIEVEYAGKLRKLVKTYLPKKKEEEDLQFSCMSSFRDMLNEINDLAGQHEIISENLNQICTRDVQTRAKELKEEKKRNLVEGVRHQNHLQTQLANLDRAKKNYEKAFRASETALETFQRADADLNLSRAEVEKTRLQSLYKSQQCEDTKKEYANQLDKANEMQNSFYRVLMPSVFQGLQDVDQRRVKCMKLNMKQTTEMECRVYPIINKCFDGILKSADAIDDETDSNLVIERFKSGFQPPEDIPFEDLSAIKNGEAPPIQPNGYGNSLKPESQSLTYKGTMSAGKSKKRTGIFGIFGNTKPGNNTDGRDDYSELPPNQRRKKLQQKIDEFSAKIQQETAARDGLVKMQSVYQSNPNLGDPSAIEGQLRESVQRLQKLQQEMHKYQSYLNEMDMPQNGGYGSSNGSRTSQNRSSGSDESLSRSASDLSQNNHHHNKPSAPGTPLPSSHGSSNSPESGISTSHTSLPDSDFEQNDTENGEYDDPLPVLGTCEALYSFEGKTSSEGSIPMYLGEQLYVVELDQGDGWTRVRRQNSLEEGFVPTSYVRITLYSNC
ncbi:formin-binding protein 1-like isoform X2 [Folsomia candida]|uniref:formin-binding protein 1-like isoform X2 n=1 Tax=Folsomia candida TaxID=158441 RepID=UPI000B904191|nr:formin-binding protein 1-like isoform X2 [Folsomia candida]